MGMISEAKQFNRKNEKYRVGFGRTEVSILPFWSFLFEIYKMGMVSEANKNEP